MNKIKVFKYLIGAVILLNFQACDSLKKILEKKSTIPVNVIPENNKKDISGDLAALSSEAKAELKGNFPPDSDVNLSDYYTQNYVDSLRAILVETGNLKINTFESFLVKHIRTKAVKDTIYLTNLYVNSPTKGEVKSYEFDVKKNDVIYYEITNTKRNTLKEVSIVEGGKTRFLKNNLKKKTSLKGVLKIEEDNVLTVNLSNDRFIKNMGFLKSKLKITLKKTAPELRIKIENRADTIVVSKPFIEEVNDTIYKIIDSKSFTLGPRLDITGNYKQNFTINVGGFDTLIGWGYWIGLGKDSLEQYNTLSESESPLIVFSKNELRKLLVPIALPVNLNKDVNLIIKNQSLDVRSYNYAANFAFYQTDNLTEKNVKKAEIYLTNNSTLYEYDVSYNVVAVGVVKIKNEIMKDFLALKNYIYITLLKDE